MSKHVYLVKDNSKLVAHCRCEYAMITYPPQLDCPWCGCGWLFTCIDCRKAFTFARGEVVNESWEATAQRDLTNRWKKSPSTDEIGEWVGAMQELLAEVEAGRQYVCFDGAIIPTDAATISFEGWHSRHDLDFIPQVAALVNPSVQAEILSNPGYWQSNAINRD